MTPQRPYALVVTSYDPGDGGGAPLVTHGRMQSLYRLGYEVGLLRDSKEGVNARELAQLCSVVERPPWGGQRLAHVLWNLRRLLVAGTLPRWTTGTWLALKREVDRRRPVLVLLDGIRTAEYGVLLRQHGFGGRVLLNEHNVEYDLIDRQRVHTKRLGKRLELRVRSWRLRKVESRLSQYADACLALSTNDRDHLARLNPGFHCELVPPAVDLARFQPADHPGASPEVLFIGSCHWPPNLDGLEWFTRDIWPRIRAGIPDARLTVVGRGPPDWLAQVEGARAEGYVPDERPYYARARVVIVPLRFGSGVRIKILNALAMARPVVSTSLGAEGIAVVSGQSIELADSPESFADRTLALLKTPAAAAAIGAAGHAVCQAWYAPEAVDRRLRGVIAGEAAPSLPATASPSSRS